METAYLLMLKIPNWSKYRKSELRLQINLLEQNVEGL